MNILISSLKVYLKILRKNGKTNLFSIFFSIIGVTCFLVIMSYSSYEMSYDKYQKDYSQIYRINHDKIQYNKLIEKLPIVIPKIGPDIKSEFPEILEYTRFYLFVSTSVGFGQDIYTGDKIYACDSSCFSLFSIPFLNGDPKSALNRPNTAVITQSLANKIFGNNDPIGKVLKISNVYNDYHCEITGVIKDIPKNSHLEFECLLSFSTLEESYKWNFDFSEMYYTYIKVHEKAKIEELQEKLNNYIESNYSWYTREFQGLKYTYSLEPISHIYLHSEYQYSTKKGNYQQIRILIILALSILLITIANYVNNSNVRIIRRIKEIFTRNVLGAKNTSVFFQLLAENFIFLTIIYLCSGLVILVASIFFQSIARELLSTGLGDSIMYFIGSLVIFVIMSSLVNYTSFLYLKKGGLNTASKSSNKVGSPLLFQKTMIGLQYGISILFIFCSIIFYKQINHVFSSELNMDIDNVVYTQAPILENNNLEKLNTLKKSLLTQPDIVDVSYTRNIVGQEIRNLDKFPLKNSEDVFNLYLLGVDNGFLNTYQIPIIKGRNFDENENDGNVILNQKAVKLLGFNNELDAIGKIIKNDHLQYTIVGVVEDYYHEFFNNEIVPIAMYYLGNRKPKWMSIRITPGNPQNTLEAIRKHWENLYPITLINIDFMKNYQKFKNKEEIRFTKFLIVFSIIIIMLSLYGTYALSTLEIVNERKRLMIRRVLGCSFFGLFILLIKKYLIILIVSFVISVILGYYWAGSWLSNFSSQINISGFYALTGLLIVSGLLMAIMAFHTYSLKFLNSSETLTEE